MGRVERRSLQDGAAWIRRRRRRRSQSWSPRVRMTTAHARATKHHCLVAQGPLGAVSFWDVPAVPSVAT